MKKLLKTLFLSAFAVSLVACGGEDTGQDESTGEEVDEITAWAWDPEFNIAALDIAKDYYDGETEINIIEHAQDDIIQKLNTGLSSGNATGLPNIVLIEDYRSQSFLTSYPDAFYPLDDYIETENFADYKIATTQYNGEQYGLPFDSGATGLYIRTDYLEEAGHTIDDVKDITWNEYIEIGKDIKEATGKDLLTLDPGNDLGQIRLMLQSTGSWYVEEDGETPYIADNEDLAEAFKAYKEMLDAEIVKIINDDWSQFVGSLNTGDVASVPTGNWITPSVKAEESQKGNWAVVKTPKLDIESSVNYSNLGGSSWYVLNIEGKEKAAEFLADTFASNIDMYKDLTEDLGAVGTYSPALTEEVYNVEEAFFGGQNIANNFAEWTDEIPGVNYGLHTYAIEDILIDAMQKYINGSDLSDVLKDAQEQAENQL